MKRTFLILIYLIGAYSAFPQKVKTSSGVYQMRIESYMSENEAIAKARELAEVNAIENAFGKVIFQGNSTYIQNTVTKDTVESTNVFNFMSDSYVNGEWIKTKDEKYEFNTDANGFRWIKMQVTGKVRELSEVQTSFDARPLSCAAIQCKTLTFNKGQSLYLYFRSSQSGYISIYFDDPQMKETFRILPYKNSHGNDQINFPVKQDFDYIFFSKDHDYLNQRNVDELLLETNKISEQFKIFVLFSPEPFDKPILYDKTNDLLDKKSLAEKYVLPSSTESEQFQKWLYYVRTINKKVQCLNLQITVSGK